MWYVTDPSAYGTFYARVSASDSTNWYVTDMLGSGRQIVDTSGNSLDAIVYDPWGNIVSESNAANGDRFKFDGGVYDAIQQTYLFNARWMNPQDARWESPDPTGLGPDSNPYRYVGNRPLNNADLTGLDDESDKSESLNKLEGDLGKDKWQLVLGVPNNRRIPVPAELPVGPIRDHFREKDLPLKLGFWTIKFPY